MIFQDALGKTGAALLLLIVIGAQFYCGMSSVTANSRMIYAFSRDGAVPGSQFWHRINKRTRTPTNSIWFAAVGAFILGLPYLWNPTAYAAVTSIAVIGLYIAYGIPILLRRLAGNRFQPGPWQLGRWSTIVGWIAVVWIACISILFILPQAAPGNTLATFNYAPGSSRRRIGSRVRRCRGQPRSWRASRPTSRLPARPCPREHRRSSAWLTNPRSGSR